jgi:hypothetical protein
VKERPSCDVCWSEIGVVERSSVSSLSDDLAAWVEWLCGRCVVRFTADLAAAISTKTPVLEQVEVAR